MRVFKFKYVYACSWYDSSVNPGWTSGFAYEEHVKKYAIISPFQTKIRFITRMKNIYEPDGPKNNSPYLIEFYEDEFKKSLKTTVIRSLIWLSALYLIIALLISHIYIPIIAVAIILGCYESLKPRGLLMVVGPVSKSRYELIEFLKKNKRFHKLIRS